MAKRLFDLLVSALGLLALSPLLLALALWIKLDSRGPVIFRQERVGRQGKPFLVHKFRTMSVDAPVRGPQLTVGADKRITGAGQVLRRCKLDELPQLWDVLRGAMSLVGPRPEVPKYVAMYPEDKRQVVLSVRPGITDLASLRYRNESEELARAADPERVYVEQVLPAKLALSARYVQEASFIGDLRLILATVAALWR
jgi:lipopolysaccharide/colanic/teichoic acid biosynthesis glycosyltransferase